MATGISGRKDNLPYMRRLQELRFLTGKYNKKIVSAHKYIKIRRNEGSRRVI